MGFSLKRLFGSPGGGAPEGGTGTGGSAPSRAASPARPTVRAAEAVRRSGGGSGGERPVPPIDDWSDLVVRSASGRPGVPRTRAALDALVIAKPRGWELLTWAALVGSGLLEQDRRVAAMAGVTADRQVDDYPAFARAVVGRVREIAVAAEPALDSSAQLHAFGPLGEPGDHDRIVALARRQLDLHEDALSLCEDVQRVAPPDRMVQAHLLLVGIVDETRKQLRDVLVSAVAALDSLPERVAAGETVQLTLSLVLDVDRVAAGRLAREIGASTL